jgi:ubiquinone biosynthesis protein Coq4
MTYRKQLIIWLFNKSQILYTSLFKHHEAWNLSVNDLLEFPKNSIGYHLGIFLKQHNFELLPKVERHDAYHVVTGYGINVEDEIALQCLCFGNGKRSPYLYGAMILGTLILPDYYRYYYKSYRIGKQAHPFHHYDYKTLLTVSLAQFRTTIFYKNTPINTECKTL